MVFAASSAIVAAVAEHGIIDAIYNAAGLTTRHEGAPFVADDVELCCNCHQVYLKALGRPYFNTDYCCQVPIAISCVRCCYGITSNTKKFFKIYCAGSVIAKYVHGWNVCRGAIRSGAKPTQVEVQLAHVIKHFEEKNVHMAIAYRMIIPHVIVLEKTFRGNSKGALYQLCCGSGRSEFRPWVPGTDVQQQDLPSEEGPCDELYPRLLDDTDDHDSKEGDRQGSEFRSSVTDGVTALRDGLLYMGNIVITEGGKMVNAYGDAVHTCLASGIAGSSTDILNVVDLGHGVGDLDGAQAMPGGAGRVAEPCSDDDADVSNAPYKEASEQEYEDRVGCVATTEELMEFLNLSDEEDKVPSGQSDTFEGAHVSFATELREKAYEVLVLRNEHLRITEEIFSEKCRVADAAILAKHAAVIESMNKRIEEMENAKAWRDDLSDIVRRTQQCCPLREVPVVHSRTEDQKPHIKEAMDLELEKKFRKARAESFRDLMCRSENCETDGTAQEARNGRVVRAQTLSKVELVNKTRTVKVLDGEDGGIVGADEHESKKAAYSRFPTLSLGSQYVFDNTPANCCGAVNKRLDDPAVAGIGITNFINDDIECIKSAVDACKQVVFTKKRLQAAKEQIIDLVDTLPKAWASTRKERAAMEVWRSDFLQAIGLSCKTEVSSKIKERPVQSHGDGRRTANSITGTIFQTVLFDVFEHHCIKHKGKRAAIQHIARGMAKVGGHLGVCVENDLTGFEFGLCGEWKNMTENEILQHIMTELSCDDMTPEGLLRAVFVERCKPDGNGNVHTSKQNGFPVKVMFNLMHAMRESGDFLTSGFNWFANLIMWMAAMVHKDDHVPFLLRVLASQNGVVWYLSKATKKKHYCYLCFEGDDTGGKTNEGVPAIIRVDLFMRRAGWIPKFKVIGKHIGPLGTMFCNKDIDVQPEGYITVVGYHVLCAPRAGDGSSPVWEFDEFVALPEVKRAVLTKNRRVSDLDPVMECSVEAINCALMAINFDKVPGLYSFFMALSRGWECKLRERSALGVSLAVAIDSMSEADFRDLSMKVAGAVCDRDVVVAAVGRIRDESDVPSEFGPKARKLLTYCAGPFSDELDHLAGLDIIDPYMESETARGFFPASWVGAAAPGIV